MRRPWFAAVVMAAIASVTAGCGGPTYRMSEVGECLPSSAHVVGVRDPDPPRVPCSGPHRYEVYAVTQVDIGGAWPGEDAVDQAADAACQDALASGAGIDRNDPPPGLKILRIQPSENSWTEQLDRSVECLIRLPTDRRGLLIRPDRSATTTTAPGAPTSTPAAGT